MTTFAELCAASNFSFLRGASHPAEMVLAARELGLAAISLADRNTLAGVVRGHVAARNAGLPYRVGCRLVFGDGTPDIFVWPRDRAAYGRLCRLLTLGNRRANKGECHLALADLLSFGQGMVLALAPGRRPAKIESVLGSLRDAFPGAVRLLAAIDYGPNDRRALFGLKHLSERFAVPLLASNLPLYHHPDRRRLQDVLTAIREHVTLAQAGRRLEANAERHLKPPAEMARLFRAAPEAVRESLVVLEELNFSLSELFYQYPDEPIGEAASPQEALARLVEEGARWRFPEGVPEKVRATIAHELELIARLDYARYFLTVHDIVNHARNRLKILCQGRGSAANSTVCYCLGITEVDPEVNDLLFERFLSPERNEPPDIDVDFEHERREEVMQYIYEKYGRHRTGIAATVITYRSRSAIREIGKVFGLSRDMLASLAGSIWGWSSKGIAEEDARRAGLDGEAPLTRQVRELTGQLIGFPRHLSQHVGGFVITKDRLDESVPIGNGAMADRTFIEWDKDDLDALKMLKVDILALGMLSCIRKAFDMLERDYGFRPSLASIPGEDEAVYRMLCRADSLGVFQVESRAQMTMLPRLKPKTFYDLVIEVAIVRPGPIQGDMVHPYLRRKQGLEKVHFPSPSPEHGPPDELERVLHRTLGVPLFQEQAMRIAIVAAGFTPSEADGLRRAMATFRHNGTINRFKDKFINGMVGRGYRPDFAERCFRQIEGFGEYGFPESHAASFALLVYASAWLKCHYPDVFCAALLNSQPMGFYAPAQIVRDAREHGIDIRPVDVNESDWDNRLEKEADDPSGLAAVRRRLHRTHAEMAADIRSKYALRLGFRQINGFSEKDVRRIVEVRRRGFDSLRDLWLRSGLSRAMIERLADADAFRSLGLDRRGALWAAQNLAGGEKDRLPLFDRAELGELRPEPDVDLPPMQLGEHVVQDYRFLRLSLKAHPLSFLRERFTRLGGTANLDLAKMASGRRVSVAGLVLVRQRPGSASGVIFMTLEDETGVANIIVWPKIFERFRPIVLGARLISVTGTLQNEGGVIHVVGAKLEDHSAWLGELAEKGERLSSLARADEVARPVGDSPELVSLHLDQLRQARTAAARAEAEEAASHVRQVMPRGRNFH